MIESITDWFANDWTGVLVQLFFAYTIILMVLDKQKPPMQTCILTGIALIVLSSGGSYLSSGTAFLGFVNGILWLTLGYQRYQQGRSS